MMTACCLMDRDEKDVQELAHAIFSANERLISAGNELVANLGLTSALWQVLAALEYSHEPLPAASIARNMGLTRQGVQRVVDLLAEQKMIEFLENPHHRRAKLVALTTKGRKAVAAAERAVDPLNQVIIRAVGLRRIREATKTLTAMASIISEHLQEDDQTSSIKRPKGPRRK